MTLELFRSLPILLTKNKPHWELPRFNRYISCLIGRYLFFLLLLLLWKGGADRLYAQNDPVRHATLDNWTNNVQRNIFHRQGYEGGRFYQHGLFRYFTREMDYEYHLDMFTVHHTPMKSYHFWNADNGFQSSFGSLDYQNFVIKNKFKTTVSVGSNGHFDLYGVQEENLRTENFFFHPVYRKELSEYHTIGVRHTLSTNKDDLDFSLFYQLGNNSSGILKAEISALDWPNNIVHSLITNSDRDYDVKQKYSRKPYLFSLSATSPEHSFLRAEIRAGIQPESEADVTRQATPDSSFTNREQVHYIGGLVEYFRPNFTTGIIFQRKFNKMFRHPDSPDSQYPLDFANREVSNRLGSYITTLFWNRLRVEQWTWYEYNRDQLWGSSVPDGWIPFHFRENRLLMKSILLYRRPGQGFQGGFEFSLDHRFVLGKQEGNTINRDFRRNYPDQVSGKNQRLTLKLGYHKQNWIDLMVGVSYDIDGDLYSGWGLPSPNRDEPSRFDGGFAQIRIHW